MTDEQGPEQPRLCRHGVGGPLREGGSQPVTVGLWALLGMVALGVCQDSGSPLVLPSFAGSGDAPPGPTSDLTCPETRVNGWAGNCRGRGQAGVAAGLSRGAGVRGTGVTQTGIERPLVQIPRRRHGPGKQGCCCAPGLSLV